MEAYNKQDTLVLDELSAEEIQVLTLIQRELGTDAITDIRSNAREATINGKNLSKSNLE